MSWQKHLISIHVKYRAPKQLFEDRILILSKHHRPVELIIIIYQSLTVLVITHSLRFFRVHLLTIVGLCDRYRPNLIFQFFIQIILVILRLLSYLSLLYLNHLAHLLIIDGNNLLH